MPEDRVRTLRSSPDDPPPAALAGTISLGGDMVVNRMGFGAMRLTGAGIMGPPADRGEARRVLRRAVDLGVNFIDTADAYGPEVSEEIIAETLYPYPTDLIIATKGGLERPGPDRWKPNGRPEYLRRCVERSLRRLRVERIDLWQLHRIDRHVPEDEQFGVMEDFVSEGLVRHVGLSEVDSSAIERARAVLPVATVQNRYNVLDRRWEEVVRYCAEHALGFIPWSPLGAGGLPADGLERLVRVAARLGASTLQVALAWLLARSPEILPIPGTSSVAHLEENVAAAAIELGTADMEELAGDG